MYKKLYCAFIYYANSMTNIINIIFFGLICKWESIARCWEFQFWSLNLYGRFEAQIYV